MNSSTPKASTNSTAIEYYLWPMASVDKWAYGISFMFGLPTHSYVIWLIITGTGSGVASEFFNLNLSVCELCFSFNCLLSALSNVVPLQSFTAVFVFFIGIPTTGRPLSQCLICVERYLAVVHPVTFLKYKPLRYRVICCTAVWITTLVICLGCMFTSLLYNLNRFMLLFLIQFVLFLTTQLIFLVAVLRALKQSGPGERGRERKEENHMKRRAFCLILITTVSMVVIFVPTIFASFLTIFTRLNTDPLICFAFACFMLGGFVHPVLFLQRTGKLFCFCSSSNLQL